MITLVSAENVKKDQVRVVLFADDKSEVIDGMTGADIPEVQDDDTLVPFSIAVTKNFEVAVLDSQNKWNWK